MSSRPAFAPHVHISNQRRQANGACTCMVLMYKINVPPVAFTIIISIVSNCCYNLQVSLLLSQFVAVLIQCQLLYHAPCMHTNPGFRPAVHATTLIQLRDTKRQRSNGPHVASMHKPRMPRLWQWFECVRQRRTMPTFPHNCNISWLQCTYMHSCAAATYPKCSVHPTACLLGTWHVSISLLAREQVFYHS